MYRPCLALALLSFVLGPVFSQNCLDINFEHYVNAAFNPATCRYTIDGVSMKLYNLGNPQPLCQTQGPNDRAFYAMVRRTDLPLYQGSGVLKFQQKKVGCGVPLLYTFYLSDGSILYYSETAEMDETDVTIDSIQISEVECGLVYLYNNSLVWGAEVSIQKIAGATTLLEPVNLETKQDTALFLKWAPVPNATKYLLQLDTTGSFVPPVFQASIQGTQKWVTGLENNRTYYWRVGLPGGSCQDTIWSETYEFTTEIKLILGKHWVEGPVDQVVDTLTSSSPEFTCWVVTDGTYTLSLARNRGQFTIRNGSGPVHSGMLSDTMIAPDVWLTRYTAPRAYGGNTILLDYKHDELHPIDFTLEIVPLPVPVILLHGLSSNGLMWDAVRASLLQNGWDEGLLSSPSYPNDQSFYTSADLVPSYVQQKLDLLRGEDVFVNQVSLVGHSMGGLVSRKYLANHPNVRNINRLVTIDTPHAGSEIANYVLSGADHSLGLFLAKCAFGGKPNNASGAFDIFGGAINSLQVNSDEILNLIPAPSAGVPVHAIASDYTLCDNIQVLAENRLLQALSRLTGAFGAFARNLAVPACDFLESLIGEQNDGVVRLSSQYGGLTDPPFSHFFTGSSFGYSHLGITGNPAVHQSLLPALLSEDTQAGDFSFAGFKPEKLPPPFAPNAPEDRGGQVSIILSGVNDHDTLYANNTYFLNVQGSDDVRGSMVLFYFFANPDSMVIDTAHTQAHTFPVPVYAGFEGKMNVVAMGTDGYGNIDADTLVLYVTTQTTSTQEARPGTGAITIIKDSGNHAVWVKTQDRPIGQLKILDVNGRVVLEDDIESTYKTIDISRLVPGIYFVTVQNESGVYSKSILR